MTNHRDAITGQYVTAEHAAENPDTTVSESPCAECERLRGVIRAQGVALDGYREEVERLRANQPTVRTVGDPTARHIGRWVRVGITEIIEVCMVTHLVELATGRRRTDIATSNPAAADADPHLLFWSDTPCEVLRAYRADIGHQTPRNGPRTPEQPARVPDDAETLADAWDEGYDAGGQDARAVQPTWPDQTTNPYRQETP